MQSAGSKVNKIYRELSGIAPGAHRGHGNEKKQSIVARVLETLSSILIPSLPPIIGGGMLKGVLYMFWQFGWIEMEDTLFIILNIMSDCMFYFYPFLLAVSAAKRFKTNLYLALALAGTLMYEPDGGTLCPGVYVPGGQGEPVYYRRHNAKADV